MRTTKQRSGKTEAPENLHVIAGCAGVKKSTNRTGGRSWRTADAGVLPSAISQVGGQQLSGTEAFSQESKKEAPEPESKVGIHPSVKIKLQLFPIDEGTRNQLEQDGHNPYVELTLRARKKISSVLKHLNRKWGSSTAARGEPMLFPYNIRLEKLSTYKRWTLNDSAISAGDVYAAIESPAVFRLRYGWFSNLEPRTISVPPRSTMGAWFESEGLRKGSELMDDRKEELEKASEDFKPINESKSTGVLVTKNTSMDVQPDHVDDEMKIANGIVQSVVPWDDSLTHLSIGGLLADGCSQYNISSCNLESNASKLNLQPIQLISSDISIGGLLCEASLQGSSRELKSNGSNLGLQPAINKGFVQSSVPWDDCPTTLSLLSEASLQGKTVISDPKLNGSNSWLQPTPLISDSLDAFIAGRLKSQPQASKPPSQVSHSSILDAEETCHAFPSQKLASLGKDALPSRETAGPWDGNRDSSLKSLKFSKFSELKGQSELLQDPTCQDSRATMSTNLGTNDDESSLGLAGIKWTESLGPFDVGLSARRQITRGDSVNVSEFVR